MNKEISMTVDRYPPIRTWANRILRIDLSNMSARAEHGRPRLATFLPPARLHQGVLK